MTHAKILSPVSMVLPPILKPIEMNLVELCEDGPVRFRLHEDDTWYVGTVGHEGRGYYARDASTGSRFWVREIERVEAVVPG